jgi:cation diffusion facilitator CzcD-associated flavoprotein CzcO
VHTRALVIGTGFSGLGMGIELQQRGGDLLIMEKADEVGGTWRDNDYPGCACDSSPAWRRASGAGRHAGPPSAEIGRHADVVPHPRRTCVFEPGETQLVVLRRVVGPQG